MDQPHPSRRAPHLASGTVLLVGALALAGLPAPAEPAGTVSGTPLTELSLEELGRVEVTTSTQTAIAINRAPATIYSVSADEIRQRGTRSLLQLVGDLVPGAFVTEDGDELIAAFRGVAVDNNCKVLLLIDGHDTNLEFAKGATPELELGLLEDIERVEVIVGPGSALYGSGATIAVINVITKAPPATGSEGSVYLAIGNGGTFIADSVWRTRINPDWALAASVGTLSATGFKKTNSAGHGNAPLNIGRYRFNTRASLRLQYRANTELYLRFDRVARAIWNLNATADRPAPIETFDHALVELRHEIPLGDDLALKLDASYDSYSNSRRDIENGTKIRAVGETHAAASARLFYMPRQSLSLVGGTELRRDHYGSDWSGQNFNISATYDPTTGTWTGLNRDYAHRMLTPYDRDAAGVFAQGTFELGPKLSAVLGLRYDYEETPHSSQQESFTPRIALVYTPTAALTTKLMYTTGFRQPMAILTTPDGFLLGGSGTSVITKPEIVRSIELSTSWLARPDLSLTLNTFYNRFENPHSLTTDSATGKLLFTQGGTVDFMGGEFIAHYRPNSRLALTLSHQLVRLGARADDPYFTFRAPHERTILFYPEDVTKATCDWQLRPDLSLSLTGSWVYDSLGYTPSGDIDHSGSYGLVNAALRYGNPRRDGQWGLDVHNLLNERTRVPMPATVGRPSDLVPLAGLAVVLSYYRAF